MKPFILVIYRDWYLQFKERWPAWWWFCCNGLLVYDVTITIKINWGAHTRRRKLRATDAFLGDARRIAPMLMMIKKAYYYCHIIKTACASSPVQRPPDFWWIFGYRTLMSDCLHQPAWIGVDTLKVRWQIAHDLRGTIGEST